MDSSSTSSSSGPPRAFLLALALVAIGEAGIAALLPANEGRHLVDDMLARLESPQPSRPVVVWTDSVTAGAIEKAGPGRDIHDISSTQAVSLAGAWFTYGRLLETAGPPRLLVISLVPESFGNDLDQVFTPTYFESCFTRPSEILDFAESTGRWGTSLRMAGYGFLRPPSQKRRASVRRAIREMRRPGALATERIPILRVAGVDPGVLKEQRERASQREFRMPEIPSLYLEKLAVRTAAEGTVLVLQTGALPRSVLDGWRTTGYAAGYESWMHRFAARHRHVRVESMDLFADYRDEDMYDRVHLKPVVDERYGRRVLARIGSLLAESDAPGK